MVSTRGVRYKFSEGERVLCYEPDPTKAKVLYDSKVLEVVETKDKRGRRTVEYLIHFQGWNSSWDRCVSEDFVLRDTEENRQLQRDLAEKSQLQLGAYLYRRERKKTSSTTTSGAGPSKRTRSTGFDDDGSSSSTQPDAGDTDSSSSSGAPPPQPPPSRAQIQLPSTLRDRLTIDYHLVVKRNRLSQLPTHPNVCELLEMFVKKLARDSITPPVQAAPPSTSARRRSVQQQPQPLDYNTLARRMNLIREVADGIRIYFDFLLRGHLLYKKELNQYHEIVQKIINKSELDDEAGTSSKLSDMGSPKLPEYSHLPPDPMESGTSREAPNPREQYSRKLRSQRSAPFSADPIPSTSKEGVASGTSSCEPTPGTSKQDPVAGTSQDVEMTPIKEENQPSTSGVARRTTRRTATITNQQCPRITQLMQKIERWHMLPESCDHLPSKIYGAIHLSRLFVKLPDFLSAIHMPETKLKLLLKLIDTFINFMNSHNEWFGEHYYYADLGTRSH